MHIALHTHVGSLCGAQVILATKVASNATMDRSYVTANRCTQQHACFALACFQDNLCLVQACGSARSRACPAPHPLPLHYPHCAALRRHRPHPARSVPPAETASNPRLDRANIRAAIEASLRRLQTTYVDL